MIFFIIELILIKNSCLCVLAYLKGLMITTIWYFYQGNMTNFFDVLRSINITAKSRISISYNREVGKNSPIFFISPLQDRKWAMPNYENIEKSCFGILPAVDALLLLPTKFKNKPRLPPPPPPPTLDHRAIQRRYSIYIEAKAPRPLSSVSATFPCLYMCSDCCIVYTAVAVCLYSV